MKLCIRDIIEFQYKISERKIPSDLHTIMNTEYYSESKGENIQVGSLDLTHLLRIMNVMAEKIEDRQYDMEILHTEKQEQLTKDLETVKKIRELLNEGELTI
jgi:Fic family protein